MNKNLKYDHLSHYCVDEYGNIINTKTGKCLSQTIDTYGYKQVTLTYEKPYSKHHITMKIHRIVADHFLDDKRDGQDTINHIDMNKFNNHYTNLERVSRSHNTKEAHRLLEYAGGHPKQQVVVYENITAKEFESMTTAARYLHVSTGWVSRALSKGSKVKGLVVKLKQ